MYENSIVLGQVTQDREYCPLSSSGVYNRIYLVDQKWSTWRHFTHMWTMWTKVVHHIIPVEYARAGEYARASGSSRVPSARTSARPRPSPHRPAWMFVCPPVFWSIFGKRGILLLENNRLLFFSKKEWDRGYCPYRYRLTSYYASLASFILNSDDFENFLKKNRLKK